MIQEIALLRVKPGMTTQFEKDFALAGQYIASIKGYKNHQLQRCLEDDHKYALLVQWETLEDHTVGFRESEAYQEWKRLLHHYYDPFPVVEHFEVVFENKN
ncbi:antibiotic biosynthesis monooxygenase [Algivirga pacifica]|uniref:Antibiotic biosynthesis monooxygenase n=1 Tax=Algivirga pacifica TaxID=1162670 RepID=A0ABP9D6H0_9BACT